MHGTEVCCLVIPLPTPYRVGNAGTLKLHAVGTQDIRYSGYMDNESAIVALGALAQVTRLDLFRLLVRHEPDGMAAG